MVLRVELIGPASKYCSYSADFPHFQEHRPVFPRTYSQQF